MTGFLGYTSNDIRTLFEEDSFTGLIVPNFQWKILNYGRLLNNVRDQDARFQELVLDYQRTVLSAGREVEDGLSGFLQYQAQARSLETSVEAAQTSVDKVLLQWQAGTADFNRVFTTQSQLVTQQDQLAVAQGNIALSLISVYRALGGGWQSCEKGPAAETCAKPAVDAAPPAPAEGEVILQGETWCPATPAAAPEILRAGGESR